MTVVGVTMVKDEADVIEHTVRHMLTQVDRVIVADNLSTDDTRLILNALETQYGGRLLIVDDTEPGYFQSEKMTALAHQAHGAYAADWIVPFDADEVWYSPFGRVGDVLGSIAGQWLVASATMYDHVATGHDNAKDPNPLTRLGWRKVAPGGLPKVAVRWREDLVIEQGNHGARYQGGSTVIRDQLIIRHFPYRSAEHFVRKARNGAAAYAATDLAPEVGMHWRVYGATAEMHGDEACAEHYRKWFYAPNPDEGLAGIPLVFDPAPLAT